MPNANDFTFLYLCPSLADDFVVKVFLNGRIAAYFPCFFPRFEAREEP
jgi:hypothetical protein